MRWIGELGNFFACLSIKPREFPIAWPVTGQVLRVGASGTGRVLSCGPRCRAEYSDVQNRFFKERSDRLHGGGCRFRRASSHQGGAARWRALGAVPFAFPPEPSPARWRCANASAFCSPSAHEDAVYTYVYILRRRPSSPESVPISPDRFLVYYHNTGPVPFSPPLLRDRGRRRQVCFTCKSLLAPRVQPTRHYQCCPLFCPQRITLSISRTGTSSVSR
jgi:hypothetical protein